MTVRCRLATRAVTALAGLTVLALSGVAQAQEPWAAASYRYRRPLAVQNQTGNALSTGDIVAYSYIPDYGIFDRKGRVDGKDVKIVYFNGSANVEIPQVLLPMGSSASKILFPLQAPIPAYSYLVKTDPAGKTDYASLPTGQKVLFTQVNYAGDDATGVVTLPFNFPFKNGSSNQLRIGIDGYVVPGGAELTRYDIDNPGSAAGKFVIMPWVGDFAITGSDQGVYYSADATQAVIRWELQTSASGPIIAKFALILKPNGEIRFVFSDLAQAGGAQPQKSGVGAGEPSLSNITSETGLDYSNHADVLYTQNFDPPSTTGYTVYYGNPGDDGTTGRVAPPADKLVSYTFNDNTVQGWEGASGTATDLESLTAADGALVLDGNSGGHPVAIAKNQTALTTDQIVYAKMRATGAREVAILARADDTGTGYGLYLDAFGEQGGILHRTATTYDQEGGRGPFFADSAKWHYGILRITGQDADIRIAASAFSDGQTVPATWMYTASPGESRRINSGVLGLTGWEGGGARQYLDWVYVTDPSAESASFAYGDESVNSNLGVIQGTVTFNGVGLKDATVTLVPAAGASSTVNTDAAGQYMALAPTGSYTVEFSSLFPKVFAAQTKSATIGATPVTLNADLVAFDNIVENPSFEEVDPEFSGKPRGWFRRTYGGIADFATDGSDKNTDRVPWIYSSTEARTGTRSVGFAGTTSNIQSWEVEGSAKTVNQDNRGGAALPRLPQGATITYSFYYKKATANGDIRHRPRYTNADDVNVLIGGGASNSTNAAAADWTKYEATYTNNDPATWTNPNYLAYRIYGVSNPAGEPVYVDDVVVKVTGIPAVTSLPKTFRGYVRDSNGNPIANAMVGLSDTAYNALAAPIQTAITDGVGRFKFTITDFSKTWHVQAMTSTIKNENNPLRGGSGGAVLYNNLASANVLLPADAAQDVVITYNPSATINLAAGAGLAVIDDTQPVDSAARYAISGIGDPKILESNARTVTTITDNDIATRVSLDAGDVVGGRKYPRFIVIDLGREYEFGTQVKQIQLRTDPAPVQGIQIRVSNTLPPATMTGYTQTSYTDPALSPALAWGKAVYISPNGTPINVPHPDPGDESRTLIDPNNSNRVRTITQFLTDGGTRITGRYVMLLIVNSKWNVSPVEFTVEAANGTITGKVLDNATGQPVADAYVGIHPNGANYGKTDANGNYTVVVPTFAPVILQAHKSVDGATVYPLTDVLTVNAIGGETVTAPDLFLSAPVPNVLVGSTAAQDYPGKGEEAPNVIGNIVDGDLATRWVTQPMAASDVDPTFPLNVDIDAGSAKQMNQLVLHWEAANASQYSVLVSTVFDQDPNAGTWTKVYETTQGTGGYQANGTTRTVDVISFPTQAVRYIRLVLSEEGRVSDRLSLWEVQGANAVAGAPGRADVVKIMAIVGGLQSATAGDKTRLDVNTDGKVDLLDAARILKAL